MDRNAPTARADRTARLLTVVVALQVLTLAGTWIGNHATVLPEAQAQLARFGELGAIKSLNRLEVRGSSTLSAGMIFGLEKIPLLDYVDIALPFRDDDVTILRGVKNLKSLRITNAQFTEIVELSDRNFAGIFSPQGAARGAGTLAIINRSLGIDQRSNRPEDYLLDASAIGWPNEDFYQHSIELPDPAVGMLARSATGSFRDALGTLEQLVTYGGKQVDLDDVLDILGVADAELVLDAA